MKTKHLFILAGLLLVISCNSAINDQVEANEVEIKRQTYSDLINQYSEYEVFEVPLSDKQILNMDFQNVRSELEDVKTMRHNQELRKKSPEYKITQEYAEKIKVAESKKEKDRLMEELLGTIKELRGIE